MINDVHVSPVFILSDGQTEVDVPSDLSFTDPGELGIYLNGELLKNSWVEKDETTGKYVALLREVATKAGDRVVIARDCSFSQPVKLNQYDAYDRDVVMGMFDRLTEMAGQNAEKLSRAVLANIGISEEDFAKWREGVVKPNTLTIGDVSKGEEASASISGEAPNLVLNLTLPKGDTGATGATGVAGKDGADGKDGTSVTVATAQTDTGTTITLTDASGAHTVTLSNGANGKDGTNGADGKDGVTPEFTIGTVTTLAAGSSATASITGTSAAPTLNLGIPRGADGSGASSYTLPAATTSALGGVKVGSNLSVTSDGTLSLASIITSQISTLQTGVSNAQSMASSAQTTAGQANITASNVSSSLSTHTSNSSIHVPSSGTTGYVLTKTSSGSEWSALPSSSSSTSYTLPTATSTTLGGIKVGDNLSISNGVLSVDSTLTSQISTLQTGVSNAQSMASSAQTTAGQANITANNVSSNLTTHTDNSSIHIPSSGTTGYVLTKTSSGSEWAALPSSSSSGSTTTSTDAVEKLSAEFTPTESDLGKVYLWSVDDTTNMKKGHLYKVSSKEVTTTTTESSGGSGVSFTISGVTEPDSAINGTYTEYGKNQGPDSKYYTSYSNGTYYFIMVGRVQWWCISTTSKLDFPSSPGLSIAASTDYSVYTGTGSSDDPYKLTESGLLALKSWSVASASTKVTPTFSNYSSGGTTATTTTEYYLEDITVECPVVNAYKEATDTIVYPSLKPYKITADDTIYLGCAGGVSGEVGYAEVVINVGASGSVLAGDNLTLVDSLTASKTNYCVVRWDGTTANLFVWRTE